MNLNEEIFRIKQVMKLIKEDDNQTLNDLKIKDENEIFKLFDEYGFIKIDNIDDLSNYITKFDKSLYPQFEWFYFNPRTNAFFYKVKNVNQSDVNKKLYYFGFEKRYYENEYDEKPRVEWRENTPMDYWYKKQMFEYAKPIDTKYYNFLIRKLDSLKGLYYDDEKVLKTDENGKLYFYDHNGNKLNELSEKIIPSFKNAFNTVYSESKDIFDKLTEKQKTKPIKSYKFNDSYPSLKDYFVSVENKGKELNFIS